MDFLNVLNAPMPVLEGIARAAMSKNDKPYGGQLYVSHEPYYSTAYFLLATNGIVTANTSRKLFQAKVGEASQQGSNWTFTQADTNNTVGAQFPEGQCFICTAIGFDVALYAATTGVRYTAALTEQMILTPNDMLQIQTAVSYTFSEEGDRSRILGMVGDFPSGTGVAGTGIAAMNNPNSAAASAVAAVPVYGLSQNGGPLTPVTKLAVPMILQPLRNYQHSLNFERAINSVTVPSGGDIAASYIGIRAQLFGLRYNAP